MNSQSAPGTAVPVLLLKTESTPTDSYRETLTTARLPPSRRLVPQFVPVMRHELKPHALSQLRALLLQRKISRRCRRRPDAHFGGLVFTSQRAVEAFAHVVSATTTATTPPDPEWPHLQHVPVYSVGPATTRALAAVPGPPLHVFGEHTGNGAALARFILDHYHDWHRDDDDDDDGNQASSTKQSPPPPPPPLLFLVGEQRRDIIPKTLMDPALPPHRQIEVVETVVYGTGVMESFPADFARALEAAGATTATATTTTTTTTADEPLSPTLPSLWVVVFSPTGCESMLRGLGLLGEDGRAVPGKRSGGGVFIATIGPTTRSHLLDTFGLEPDVCAAKPSPEGILEGIAEFEARIASASTTLS